MEGSGPDLELVGEVGDLLRDATEALGHLDADRLEALRLRALAIEPPGRELAPSALAELTARLRVFAAAMQATRDNLNFMETVAVGSRPCAERHGETRWDR